MLPLKWLFCLHVADLRNLKSASCATYAIAELALRLIALFLALVQVAVRFETNICFLRFVALQSNAK